MIAATTTDTLAAKPPSETEQKKAAAEVEAAGLDARRLRWEAELADFEASLEEAFSARAESPVGAVSSERVNADNDDAALLAAARRTLFESLDPRAIGAALQSIVDEEAEAERVRRLYEAMRARAERRAERVRRVLWPVVVAWAEANPPAKGATLRFSNTECKLVSKAHQGKLEVRSSMVAVRSIEQALGMDAYGCLRVSTEVMVGEARKMLQERGVDPSKLAGFDFTPPGKALQLHRPGGGA